MSFVDTGVRCGSPRSNEDEKNSFKERGKEEVTLGLGGGAWSLEVPGGSLRVKASLVRRWLGLWCVFRAS